MTSPFTGLEQPRLSKSTCEWLVNDRQVKMLGLSATGILWQDHPSILNGRGTVSLEAEVSRV